MTTQTQPDPKPCQLWRDLPDGGSLQPGDREMFTTAYKRIMQRPVTPGQCDCAGLREALIDAEIRLGRLYDGQGNLTPKHFHETPLAKRIRTALAQPCTCAGKSAEERIRTRCPACHNTTLAVHDGHLFCTWIDCSDPTLIDRDGDLADADTARRKLAEAEEHSSKLERSVWESGRQLAKQSQFPVWRSYATPPTEQDGVMLLGFGNGPYVLCLRPNRGVELVTWSARPFEMDDQWAPITLPKLPPEPEQDADEAAFEKAYKEARIKMGDKPFFKTDFTEGWQAALDFARNQERL